MASLLLQPQDHEIANHNLQASVKPEMPPRRNSMGRRSNNTIQPQPTGDRQKQRSPDFLLPINVGRYGCSKTATLHFRRFPRFRHSIQFRIEAVGEMRFRFS